MILNKQPLVEDLLQRPPHALHIVGIHGPVGTVHIDPVTHAVGHLGEFTDVPQHRFLAAIVELGHAKFFDVLLTGETQFLFNGKFNG